MPKMPEFLPVPTVADLVRRGFADLLIGDKDGKVRMAHLSGKGQALISEALVENGRRWRTYDEAKRAESKPSTGPVVIPAPDDPWPVWE